MTKDIYDELLIQAEQAFSNQDPRKGFTYLHQILNNDFNNEPAWQMLYRVMQAKQPYEVFKLEMTKKYFPKYISRLTEKLSESQLQENAPLQQKQPQQLVTNIDPSSVLKEKPIGIEDQNSSSASNKNDQIEQQNTGVNRVDCPQCGQEKIKDKSFCPNCGFNYSSVLAAQKEQGQKDETKQPVLQEQQRRKTADGDSKSREDLQPQHRPTKSSKRKPLRSRDVLLILLPILFIIFTICCLGGLVTQQKFFTNIFAPINLIIEKWTLPKDEKTTVNSEIIGKWYKLQGMSDSIFAMDRDSEINFLQDGNFIIDAKGVWENMEGTYSLSGNTLTINWPGIYANNVHSLNSSYEVIFAHNQMTIKSNENGQLVGYSREQVSTQATPKIPDNLVLPFQGLFLIKDGQPIQLEKAFDAQNLSVQVTTSDSKPVVILNGIEAVQSGLAGISFNQGRFGIGVNLQSANGYCQVTSTTAFSNAEKAGLGNEYIISINGQPVNGNCDMVSQILRDFEYTSVMLEVMDFNGNTSIVDIPVQTLLSETRLEFTFTKDNQNYFRLTPTGILGPGIYCYVYTLQDEDSGKYCFKVK